MDLLRIFHCSGEFGDEEVEAATLEEAALKCATAHAGLDCDEICRDPWSFLVNLLPWRWSMVRGYRPEQLDRTTIRNKNLQFLKTLGET